MPTRSTVVAAATVTALLAAPAVAYATTESGGAAPAAPAPASSSASTSSSSSVASYSPPSVPGATSAPKPKRITPQQRFSVQVDDKDDNPMDATWPSATTLFTAAELRQALPGVTAVRATDCAAGTLPNGSSTAHAGSCTLELSSKAPVPDRIIVNIRGFGSPEHIGATWRTDLKQARERATKRSGLYTFYRNGAMGSSAAFTDGTTTKVLLQRGKVAGEIWFSGIGFTDLEGSYAASRKAYRQEIVPALTQLLSAKMTPAR